MHILGQPNTFLAASGRGLVREADGRRRADQVQRQHRLRCGHGARALERGNGLRAARALQVIEIWFSLKKKKVRDARVGRLLPSSGVLRASFLREFV